MTDQSSRTKLERLHRATRNQNYQKKTTAYKHLRKYKYKLEKAAQGKCCPVRSIGLRA